MANGKVHDNPITDLLVHGRHPFPPEIEALVLKLHSLEPYVFNELGWAPFDWEEGKHHARAVELLSGLIEAHGNPSEKKRLIAAYRAATEK